MDDAPSNSTTFPEILLIQENIVKNMPQSLQNGSDVFCFSYDGLFGRSEQVRDQK